MNLVLVDTNILLRGAQPTHPMHTETVNAQMELRRRGDLLCLVAQNLIEFRAVATRPTEANGLGMSQSQADAEIVRLKSLYHVVPDVPTILPEWERLVRLYGAAGKQNHDARIAAAMVAHGILTLLTFNKSDFIRYSEITPVTPTEVLTPTVTQESP